MEIKDFNWDELKEQLQKAIKLEKLDNDMAVKITILETNIEENQMVGDILKDKEDIKSSFGQFLGMNGPLDCDIEINQENKYIMMKMKNKEDYMKVYSLLNDMFFGDFFKKMIEAMMDAFKDLGDKFGDMADNFGK